GRRRLFARQWWPRAKGTSAERAVRAVVDWRKRWWWQPVGRRTEARARRLHSVGSRASRRTGSVEPVPPREDAPRAVAAPGPRCARSRAEASAQREHPSV